MGNSFGFAITNAVRDAIKAIPDAAWTSATETDGEARDRARLAELTGHLDLSAWPTSSRIIARRERPVPGAPLSLLDTIEGLRHTTLLTDTRPRGPKTTPPASSCGTVNTPRSRTA